MTPRERADEILQWYDRLLDSREDLRDRIEAAIIAHAGKISEADYAELVDMSYRLDASENNLTIALARAEAAEKALASLRAELDMDDAVFREFTGGQP